MGIQEVSDVQITGSSFAAGATVSLLSGIGPAPAVSNVIIVDDQLTTATLTTSGGGPGKDRVWDVCVTNADGTSSCLIGGLTVSVNATSVLGLAAMAPRIDMDSVLVSVSSPIVQPKATSDGETDRERTEVASIRRIPPTVVDLCVLPSSRFKQPDAQAIDNVLAQADEVESLLADLLDADGPS